MNERIRQSASFYGSLLRQYIGLELLKLSGVIHRSHSHYLATEDLSVPSSSSCDTMLTGINPNPSAVSITDIEEPSDVKDLCYLNYARLTGRDIAKIIDIARNSKLGE